MIIDHTSSGEYFCVFVLRWSSADW